MGFLKVFPRDFLLSVGTSFGAFFCISLFFLHPLALEMRGYGAMFSGLSQVIFQIALLLSRPWANAYLHTYGTRKGLVFGALLMASGTFLLLFFSFPLLLLTGRIVQGTGFGFVLIGSLIHQAKTLPADLRGRGFGISGLASIVPQLTLLPIAELLVRGGYAASVPSLALVAALATAALALPLSSLAREKGTSHSLFRTAREALTHRETRAVFLSAGTAALSSAPLLLFVANAAREWGSYGSLFLWTNALVCLCMRFFFGGLVDRKGRAIFPLVFGSLTLGSCLASWGTLASPLFLLAGGAFYGVGFGLSYPLLYTELARVATPENQTAYFSLFATVFDVVWLGVPLTFALVAPHLGYGITLRCFSLLLPPLLFLLHRWVWPALRQESPSLQQKQEPR